LGEAVLSIRQTCLHGGAHEDNGEDFAAIVYGPASIPPGTSNGEYSPLRHLKDAASVGSLTQEVIMKGIWIFLKKYGGRGILLGVLTVVLLRLTGADAAALAQNCGQWSVISSPNAGTGDNILDGVTAISPNDVWAVGTSASATLT
jgi:hypothetical protein